MSRRADGFLTNHLYDALFAPHAECDDIFLLLDGQGGSREVTFRSFIGHASQMAHALCAQGVEAGDRVVVEAPKCPEMLALYAATLQVGAVFFAAEYGIQTR